MAALAQTPAAKMKGRSGVGPDNIAAVNCMDQLDRDLQPDCADHGQASSPDLNNKGTACVAKPLTRR
jgi:hypothetical protein